eukprot:TRINITY_DN27124_c0_g1_i1.p1 TRINITY_DN27124_c0_g1~~TRINITY_DN27124_c0_g1_i1.p1  ORF type:complete len:261 (+),score=67.65 TRINITY_DN27124_c0_g1_i1:64-846(+)
MSDLPTREVHADVDAVATAVLANKTTESQRRSAGTARSTNSIPEAGALRRVSDVLLQDEAQGAVRKRCSSSKRMSVQKASNAGIKRDVVVVSGRERPIRLDTQDVLSEHLNNLVRETRHAELYKQTRNIGRQKKLQVVGAVVKKMRDERVRYSLQRRDMVPEDWQSVNARKARAAPEDPLHYVAPELKPRVLRSMEKAVCWSSMQVPEHPSAAQARQLSSQVPPVGIDAFAPGTASPLSGAAYLPTPGSKAVRPLKYWDL